MEHPYPDPYVQQIASRAKWKREEGEFMVASYRRSADSINGFARTYGIQRQRIARWIHKLEEEQWRSELSAWRQTWVERTEETATFVEVHVPDTRRETVDAPPSSEVIVVRLPGDVVVEASVEPGVLQPTLEAIRAVYGC